MRLYVHANAGSQPRFTIPWDAHLSFMSNVYEAVGEQSPDYATELHQREYAPPFSYSGFQQTGPYDVGEAGLTCQEGYWVINSPEGEILNACANYAQAEGKFTAGHTTVPVTGVEVTDIHAVDGTVRYKTLSPIAVGEAQTERDETKEWYRPDDGMWFARVCQNVRDRMLGTDADVDPEFVLEQVHWTKPKLLAVGSNAKIPCARCELTITHNEETGRFVQNHGLGEKTGMGFGTVMPTDEIP